MIEGSVLILEFNGAVAKENSPSENPIPMEDVFDFIDHTINNAYCRIIIHIAHMDIQKPIEEWLIKHHHPMLTYLTIKSVEVTNVIPKYAAYISPRAIRFTNFQDMERYII